MRTWLRAKGLAHLLGLLRLVSLLVLAGGASACGVLSAITNPKAAWALNEPATMSVVVRRAEVADETAHQIERILGEVPVGAEAAWVKETTISGEDAEALLKEASAEPIYAMTQVRVVPAEAWLMVLSGICGGKGEHESLVAALGEEPAAQYADVAGQSRTLAEIRLELAREEAALDDEKLSASDKKDHEAKAKELTEKIDAIEAELSPKQKALVKLVGEKAKEVKAPLADAMKLAVVNLRRAVDDARVAASVAVVRYPFALTGMTDDVQVAAKRFAADVIEEQIHRRPELSGLSPEVKLNGTDVDLVLNGIPASEIGSIKPGALVTETTSRTKDYVERVLTLLAVGNDTEDLLAFEASLLDAWIKGLGADSKMEGATDITDVEVKTTPAPAAPGAADKSPKQPAKKRAKAASRSIGGLAIASCKSHGNGKGGAPKTAQAGGGKKSAKADGKGNKPPAKAGQKPSKGPAHPKPGSKDCKATIVKDGVETCM